MVSEEPGFGEGGELKLTLLYLKYDVGSGGRQKIKGPKKKNPTEKPNTKTPPKKKKPNKTKNTPPKHTTIKLLILCYSRPWTNLDFIYSFGVLFGLICI